MRPVRTMMVCLAVVLALLLRMNADHVSAGNIDPQDLGTHYAYSENAGWLNFKPAVGEGVTVTDTHVSGYVWAENIGWINLSPSHGGVINDGIGNLSGWAWGENVGWISFSCKDTDTCDSIRYGVTVDPATGVFSGYAWGENIGWISFASMEPIIFSLSTAWRDNVLPGDINDQSGPDITDAIMGLQICAGIEPPAVVHMLADINDDDRIGLEEVIFILQILAGLRT